MEKIIANKENTKLSVLGERTFKNKVFESRSAITDSRILYSPFISNNRDEFLNHEYVAFQVAGPTKYTYFDPQKVKAGILTCGGICPGLNDVIRSIVMCHWHNYGNNKIFGFRYGLQGFISKYGHEVVELNPEKVSEIHNSGGTLLGTSRGPQSTDEIVNTLELLNINQLYLIGGNGTLKAAHKICQKISERKLKISVITIPKTIDNDIMYVSQSFGFNTAVEMATTSIRSAHTEAISSLNGIGLVKLMGRDSGFISATASIAQRDVNFVLVPEVPFELDGDKGFLNALKARIQLKKHAVIVVAEGAGQNLMKPDHSSKDASGNVRLGDIGVFLKNKINDYFSAEGIHVNLKYIDPSYIIRSVPANTYDNLFSATLGEYAVHASMSGYTDIIVSWWHGVYCLIPSSLAVAGTKKIEPYGRLWANVLSSTGQGTYVND